MIDLQIKDLELYMNYNAFITSIKSGFPPAELTNPELALWHAMNDNWNSAHPTAQSIKNELGELGFMPTFTGLKGTLKMQITGTGVRTDHHLRIP